MSTSRRPKTAARPRALLARAGLGLTLAIPLAYAGTLWLQLLHSHEGAREPGEPGPLMHWLRDGTLALPAVALVVVLATLLARRALAAGGALRTGRLAGAVLATSAGLGAAVAFALTNPLHGMLFAAEHGGHELPLALHALRDGTIALAAMLPVAMLLVALRSLPALRVPAPRLRGGVLRLAALLVVAGPLAVSIQQGIDTATAQTGAGRPCPSDAPVKRFAVRAIDVDIPLNRFGDHDPAGRMYVLAEDVAAVRRQEASRQVSIGLRDDAIQPLVIRANLGDCVEIEYADQAGGGDFGLHIDGLVHQAASSGDAVGENVPSAPAGAETRLYRYYVPEDPELEGTHYIRPGPGQREAVAHGLFGALAVEPAGSVYLHPDTGLPLRSGWEAMVKPEGKKAFREYVKVYHEVGDEDDDILARDGRKLPTVDPITDAYRPGSRAINYRSEPFMNRLERAPEKKSLAYNSYTFGDPATPVMRGYLADPTKIRVIHAGSEMFHVYHLHGGGIRWPQNPYADSKFDYQVTGLNKWPRTGGSNRLDSQSFGPGESYTMEIEGGAGGVQQAVGDLLEHCHIPEHYVAGMWSFWRVMNTLQPDLQPLPDRASPPDGVTSAELIGRTMPDGTELTASNLDDWIKPLIPPRGIPKSENDGSVWDWTIDSSAPNRPLYLGEPEETENWPNLPRVVPGHPSALPGDEFVGDRPKLRFNPLNGRPAYPLLRPQIGRRAPQSPNGHSGAPYLGNTAAGSRPDGLCPQDSPVRRFDLTTIQTPVQVTRNGAKDPTGKVFVLNKDKAAVRAGTKPVEPLAIRANLGDCVALTLSTELEPDAPGSPLPQSNLHIHHVQFDPQGSDGASAGMVYDQSVLPYRLVDPRLTAAAAAGDRLLALDDVTKFQPGVFIAVGHGTEQVEVHEVTAVDADASTVTLAKPLADDHAAGQWAGTEFTQMRWYPDVDLDNVFWHDHVDGIHGWSKGLVGQLIVEPKGSTYHDPRTGEEVDSGTIVDIRTPNPLAPGLVNGSFREMALWTIDDNPVTDSTLNLRSEPWSDRLAEDADPSLLFSSWRHGDPFTPLPQAYRGDPFVLRTVNVSGNGIDSLHLAGHRFYLESKLTGADGAWQETTPKDSLQYGVSERFTAILEGGAGGAARRSGDFLYMNGIGRRFRQGAWGLLRVLPGTQPDLQPLPGTSPPSGTPLPEPTGGRPPTLTGAGQPCPAAAPERRFAVSAVDLPGGQPGVGSAFVPTARAADVRAGRERVEPLVLHAAAGECLEVEFTNERRPGVEAGLPRASFHVAKLAQTVASSGVNAGFNAEQTVAPGEQRTYRYFVDSYKIGSAAIADFGGNDTGAQGLYGAVVVAPQGATFHDPRTGLPRDVGSQVDVHAPGRDAYRDFTLILADDDAQIGQNTMPYPDAVDGPALVNYRSEPRPDDAAAFSSRTHGDPATPVLRAYAGDPTKVHVLGAPGSEQPHAFSLGGLSWRTDGMLAHSNLVSTAAITPWLGLDALIEGGAGGQGGTAGDFWYGDLRRPFAQAGMWGLLRSLPATVCAADLRPLPGRPCAESAEPDPSTSPSPAATPAAPAPAPAAPIQAPAAPVPATPPASDESDEDEPDARSGRRRRGRDRLRDLRPLARSRSLASLRRPGLELWLTVPAGMRSLKVALLPARRDTASVRATLRVDRAGTRRLVWRLRRSQLARLRPGRHILAVQGGGESLKRTLRLRGGHR